MKRVLPVLPPTCAACCCRFSISWPRLLPDGKKGSRVNPAAVLFYKSVISELLKRKIQPVVTLYHWDLPAGLESDYTNDAGWLKSSIANEFAYFADVAFKSFGGSVKRWITINEPYTACMVGYRYGSNVELISK